MIDTLLQFIAPHHCCECGETGTLLCANCKYDITHDLYEMCIACAKAPVGSGLVCSQCRVPYERAWCVGGRQGSLEKLVDTYKFHNAKAAYKPLAALLNDCLPMLPSNIVVIPVPTIQAHIRQRGYDHMLLVAKQFSKLRGYPVNTSLERLSSTSQRGNGRRQRIKQAKEAFHCARPLDSAKIYLLLDDVVTTGSTIKYATKALNDAGATAIWVATISRQALD